MIGAERQPSPAETNFTLALSNLISTPPGPRRVAHSLAYQAPLRFAARVLSVGAEVAVSAVTDIISRRRARGTIMRLEPGRAKSNTAFRRVALYAHYSKSGQVSPMVTAQLAEYRALGFDVVFITNSESITAAGWRAAAEDTVWLIQRRNFGFDFGAWRAASEWLLAERPALDELLLVNDSVLGPLRPLASIMHQARTAGAGAVGLTESRQGGVHLQSYFLLLLGAPATTDAMRFLSALRLTTSKWLMVQRGEIQMTRSLISRGHRVAALFGYARMLEVISADRAEWDYLAALVKHPGQDAAGQVERSLLRWPLNPTHHMWRGLARCAGFPFIKTQLVVHNPGRLQGVQDWHDLFVHGAPCSAFMAAEHLKTLGADLPQIALSPVRQKARLDASLAVSRTNPGSGWSR